MRKVRARFWMECALAVLSAGLAVSTMVWNNWIELLFEVEPDGGDGSFEWGIVVVFAVVAVLFAIIARIELHRVPAPSAQG